jgi:hypothetical protein
MDTVVCVPSYDGHSVLCVPSYDGHSVLCVFRVTMDTLYFVFRVTMDTLYFVFTAYFLAIFVLKSELHFWKMSLVTSNLLHSYARLHPNKGTVESQCSNG